jgi:hypothetical protein
MNEQLLAPFVSQTGMAVEESLLAELALRDLGGPGSGYFGHAGRPGEVGGSAPTSTDIDAESTGVLEQALIDETRAIVGRHTDGQEQWEGAIGAFDREELASATPHARGLVKQHIVNTLGPALAERVPEEDFHALFAKGLVQERLDGWADTSGDHDPRAIRMQHAVAAEFGIEDAAFGHLESGVPSHAENPAYWQLPSRQLEQKLDRLYSRVEYERTQAWFKEQGIKHVTLFRGQRDSTFDRTEEGVIVRMQPASSWTTDFHMANDFAKQGTNWRNGVIFAAKVPVSRILSTALTGRGCLNEAEVLVLGGKMKAKVYTSTKTIKSYFEAKKSKLKAALAALAGKKMSVIEVDAEIVNADWPKRTPDRMNELRTAAAKVWPTDTLLQAADAQQSKLEVAVTYAFAMGRKALSKTSPNPDVVANAVKRALFAVLPKTLLAVLNEGGRVGLEILQQQLRTAGGPGSGHFGHAGRPGEVGGSAPFQIVYPDGSVQQFRASDSFRTAKKDKKTSPFSITFNVKNPHAKQWAEEHATELAKDLSDTTRDAVRRAIAEIFETGDADEAFARIREAVGNKARAALIARTEVLRAAHAGQRLAWDQAVDEGFLSGDERRVWIATPINPCPLCQELDGKTAQLGKDYPLDGGEGPPLHPNCRCTEGITYD